jgi:hypothetical protein
VRSVEYLVASLGLLPGTFLDVDLGNGMGSLAEVADVGTGADHTAR